MQSEQQADRGSPEHKLPHVHGLCLQPAKWISKMLKPIEKLGKQGEMLKRAPKKNDEQQIMCPH